MKAKQNLLLVGIIVIALFLNGCSGASMPTPIPLTTTPTPPPDMPKITIADTVFWLTAVVEKDKALELQAKPGYRLLEVGFQTDTGTLEHIGEITKEFATMLSDKEGNQYPSVVRGTGIYCPGAGPLQVCWTFAAPENEKTLWLNLPDGTTIELEPFIK